MKVRLTCYKYGTQLVKRNSSQLVLLFIEVVMHVFLSMTLIVVKPLSTSIIGNPNSSNKVEYSKVTVSLLLLLEQNLIREKDK